MVTKSDNINMIEGAKQEFFDRAKVAEDSQLNISMD